MRRIYRERPTHSIRLPDDVHEQLARLAAEEGVSMTAVVQQLIDKEYKRKKPAASAEERKQRRRHVRWTQGAVLTAIQARLAGGRPVNSWAVQTSDAGLWEGGCRVFGSWDATLKAAGVETPDRTCGQPAKGLKRLRLARKLTQYELGLKAGTTQGNISAVENERKHPTWTLVAALAHALNCTKDEILQGERPVGSYDDQKGTSNDSRSQQRGTHGTLRRS